jgi:hypothetical protein
VKVRLENHAGPLRTCSSLQARQRRLIKKNRQFLAKPAGTRYCFSESPIGRRAAHDFGVKSCERLGNGAASHLESLKTDSEMAPGSPSVQRSIRRSPYSKEAATRSTRWKISSAASRRAREAPAL